MPSNDGVQIAWTAEALAVHQADVEKARRRRDQETRRSSVAVPHSRKHAAKHNRAAANRAWKREYSA